MLNDSRFSQDTRGQPCLWKRPATPQRPARCGPRSGDREGGGTGPAASLTGGAGLLLSLCLASAPRTQQVSTGLCFYFPPVSASNILMPSLLVCKMGRYINRRKLCFLFPFLSLTGEKGREVRQSYACLWLIALGSSKQRPRPSQT